MVAGVGLFAVRRSRVRSNADVSFIYPYLFSESAPRDCSTPPPHMTRPDANCVLVNDARKPHGWRIFDRCGGLAIELVHCTCLQLRSWPVAQLIFIPSFFPHQLISQEPDERAPLVGEVEPGSAYVASRNLIVV